MALGGGDEVCEDDGVGCCCEEDTRHCPRTYGWMNGKDGIAVRWYERSGAAMAAGLSYGSSWVGVTPIYPCLSPGKMLSIESYKPSLTMLPM